MRRFQLSDGAHYVSTDINGEPTLCLCKPWHECTRCGLYEHRGSYCSYCGSKTHLRNLDTRPSFSLRAVRAARVALGAT